MCFCSVGGCLQFGVVSAAAGFEALFSIAIGAPVFSSPVWCGDEVVVGARDDRLHCVRGVGALVARARLPAGASSGGDAAAAVASADARTCNGALPIDL